MYNKIRQYNSIRVYLGRVTRRDLSLMTFANWVQILQCFFMILHSTLPVSSLFLHFARNEPWSMIATCGANMMGWIEQVLATAKIEICLCNALPRINLASDANKLLKATQTDSLSDFWLYVDPRNCCANIILCNPLRRKSKHLTFCPVRLPPQPRPHIFGRNT